MILIYYYLINILVCSATCVIGQLYILYDKLFFFQISIIVLQINICQYISMRIAYKYITDTNFEFKLEKKLNYHLYNLHCN